MQLTFDYPLQTRTMTQLDPNQADKSLDAAIRDDAKRAQLVTGVGKALLAKIPAQPKQ